jgi:hypothetical protein
MREDIDPSAAEAIRRLERQVWLSFAVAASFLFVGGLVAVALRDRHIISEAALGWAGAVLTLVAVLLFGAVGRLTPGRPVPSDSPKDRG